MAIPSLLCLCEREIVSQLGSPHCHLVNGVGPLHLPPPSILKPLLLKAHATKSLHLPNLVLLEERCSDLQTDQELDLEIWKATVESRFRMRELLCPYPDLVRHVLALAKELTECADNLRKLAVLKTIRKIAISKQILKDTKGKLFRSPDPNRQLWISVAITLKSVSKCDDPAVTSLAKTITDDWRRFVAFLDSDSSSTDDMSPDDIERQQHNVQLANYSTATTTWRQLYDVLCTLEEEKMIRTGKRVREMAQEERTSRRKIEHTTDVRRLARFEKGSAKGKTRLENGTAKVKTSSQSYTHVDRGKPKSQQTLRTLYAKQMGLTNAKKTTKPLCQMTAAQARNASSGLKRSLACHPVTQKSSSLKR